MALFKVVLLLFTHYFLNIYATYHWVVTEDGKIQSEIEKSGFPLTRHDDLIVFLEQEEKFTAAQRLQKQITSLKSSIDNQWSTIEKEEDYEHKLYATDEDCLLGRLPVREHSIRTDFVDYELGVRPKIRDGKRSVGPDCTAYSQLDFSMRTFPHLETLSGRGKLNLTLHPEPSNSALNLDINLMLKRNSSDWTAYNIASYYWRAMGNGTNALECARRALFFSPRNVRYIALLNLGTLLQEFRRLGEAAIVLHSAVDHNPVQDISHLALGNVYIAIGDYRRSLTCYENVISLNPRNIKAVQMKHALLCDKKLQSGLIQIHNSLQSTLKDLERHNAMHEEWVMLQNQVNWERDSTIKELTSISQPVYLNIRTLVEAIGSQSKTLVETGSINIPLEPSINFQPRKAKSKNQKNSKDDGTCEACKDGKCENCKEGKKEKKKKGSRKSKNTKISLKELEEDLIEEDETELENYITNPEDHAIKTKVNSIITYIKKNFEHDIDLLQFRQKLAEQLSLLKEVNSDK